MGIYVYLPDVIVGRIKELAGVTAEGGYETGQDVVNDIRIAIGLPPKSKAPVVIRKPRKFGRSEYPFLQMQVGEEFHFVFAGEPRTWPKQGHAMLAALYRAQKKGRQFYRRPAVGGPIVTRVR